jgi:thiol-disulfide isomerase/thioredoxin
MRSFVSLLVLSLVIVNARPQEPSTQNPAETSQFRAVAPTVQDDRLVFAAQIPAFEARDLLGRTWRESSFRGKVTLVDVWATYCLPCIKEHAALQAFHDQAKAMDNVQVLTFSLDRDVRRVRAYMAERGYTFPVISNISLVEQLFPSEGGIPKAWVIDRDARRSDAFRVWSFGRVLMELEKFANSN